MSHVRYKVIIIQWCEKRIIGLNGKTKWLYNDVLQTMTRRRGDMVQMRCSMNRYVRRQRDDGIQLQDGVLVLQRQEFFHSTTAKHSPQKYHPNPFDLRSNWIFQRILFISCGKAFGVNRIQEKFQAYGHRGWLEHIVQLILLSMSSIVIDLSARDLSTEPHRAFFRNELLLAEPWSALFELNWLDCWSYISTILERYCGIVHTFHGDTIHEHKYVERAHEHRTVRQFILIGSAYSLNRYTLNYVVVQWISKQNKTKIVYKTYNWKVHCDFVILLNNMMRLPHICTKPFKNEKEKNVNNKCINKL